MVIRLRGRHSIGRAEHGPFLLQPATSSRMQVASVSIGTAYAVSV